MTTLSIGKSDTSNNAKATREHKGKSIIDFPENYTLIDIETTGFDPKYDLVIEVAAIRYRGSVPVDSFTSLVQPKDDLFAFDSQGKSPQYVNSFITELTGITNEMLLTAPTTSEVLPLYFDFIKGDILIGHNVNFDINFLYDLMERKLNVSLTNDFIDTLRIARRVLPDLPHHRLDDLLSSFGLPRRELHRSLSDCEATWLVYQKLHDEVLHKYNSIDEFASAFKKSRYRRAPHIGITPSTGDFDENHPLYGKHCVFTGHLEKMLRRDAMQIVVNAGGSCGGSVTKKTNFLVLGNNDYCSSIKDGKSTKQKKAEEYILGGCDLQIISEDVFYDLIDEC